MKCNCRGQRSGITWREIRAREYHLLASALVGLTKVYDCIDRDVLKVQTEEVDASLFPWSGRVLGWHHHSVFQFPGGRRRLIERAAGVQLQRLTRRHAAAAATTAADTGIRLLDELEHLAEIVLNGGHGGDDRRRAETVCDEREVGESALNGRVEYRRRTSVAEWRSILIQKIDQLLHYLPAITPTHAFLQFSINKIR